MTLSGYSTALFSTWYFVEELDLLFDAGDGVVSALLNKARKVNHVLVSHADRDHLAGLLQFNQLNARPGFPVIYYPKDCGSFGALEEFSKRFDPHVSGTVWKPVTEHEELRLKDDVVVQPVRNGHVVTQPHLSKSLGYKVYRTKQKLKPELAALPADEIRRIVMERGKESTTHEVRTNIISYSGDTPVEDYGRFNHSEILIHEATFLGGPEDAQIKTHGNKHSRLDEVMEMASTLQLGALVLGHFSSRYPAAQIEARILHLCERYAIQTPVHRVLPGVTSYDILRQKPINS